MPQDLTFWGISILYRINIQVTKYFSPHQVSSDVVFINYVANRILFT